MISKPITGRKIRFGLVGCGRISANHIEAIQKHGDNAELVGVCDSDSKALEAAVAKTGAKGYPSLGDLLKDTAADVVTISTPSGLHAEQTIQVARSGRHVVVEKPMAIRLEDGYKMDAACREAGVQLFVVKQNRRNATLEILKRAVDEERFGKIYMVSINVFWTRPQSYYDQAPWRGTRDMDGGAFMNQASHYVDLLTWLIGPIESVQAYTATLARKIEMEDTGVAAIRWKSGALGSINVTMLTYPKNMEGSITILGEKGSVRIGGMAVNEIQRWEFQDKHPDDERVKAASYETTSVYGHGHPLYYDNVIKTLRGTERPQTSGEEGLKSLETLIAIYRSAQEGKAIRFPLAPAYVSQEE